MSFITCTLHQIFWGAQVTENEIGREWILGWEGMDWMHMVQDKDQ